jgi:hypothetical protein
LAVVGEGIGKKFQSDKSVKPSVLGFVHHTHAATADCFQNAVMRNGLADESVGGGYGADVLGY